MNWGKGITIVFCLFAALICTLVYKSTKTKFDLVSTEYYKDELNYQDRIESMNNANKLSDASITQNAESVIITMPKEQQGVKVQGEAWFYCKTDAAKDKKIALTPADNGVQVIDKKRLTKGIYQVKLDWKDSKESYYTEKDIVIN
ncbi:MAG: FixH family protein [Filimonas sp.]|nr:FixH family protein [Filimonas sp.]